MLDARFALPFAALLGLAAPALAQDGPRKLGDLDAERINAFQILIDFEYDGGACEATEPATLGDLVDGTLSVTIPVVATSEVCTMQIKKHEIKQAIETRDEVTRVNVTLTAADGQVIGEGATDVELD